jgi:2'-5' RNA ligase
MRTLYTVAYPDLASEDAAWIEAFRQDHDPQHRLVRTHLTLSFGCTGVPEAAYLAEVDSASRSHGPIRFTCRYAMPWFEPEGPAFAFLVPDEGYSGLSRLHDSLHRGEIGAHRRSDRPFVPHITIGSCNDPGSVRDWCRAINERGIEVVGVVTTLTVATNGMAGVDDLAHFPLSGAGSAGGDG